MTETELGPICWLDATRPCGGDCMAYNTFVPDDPSDMPAEQRRCSVLVSSHRAAKHLVILARISAEQEKRQQIEIADRKRMGGLSV